MWSRLVLLNHYLLSLSILTQGSLGQKRADCRWPYKGSWWVSIRGAASTFEDTKQESSIFLQSVVTVNLWANRWLLMRCQSFQEFLDGQSISAASHRLERDTDGAREVLWKGWVDWGCRSGKHRQPHIWKINCICRFWLWIVYPSRV